VNPADVIELPTAIGNAQLGKVYMPPPRAFKFHAVIEPLIPSSTLEMAWVPELVTNILTCPPPGHAPEVTVTVVEQDKPPTIDPEEEPLPPPELPPVVEVIPVIEEVEPVVEEIWLVVEEVGPIVDVDKVGFAPEEEEDEEDDDGDECEVAVELTEPLPPELLTDAQVGFTILIV